MENDRTELKDMAAQMPEKVKLMSAQYDDWAERSFVKRAMKPKRKRKK